MVAEGAAGIVRNLDVFGGEPGRDTPLLVESRVEDDLVVGALVAPAQDADLGTVDSLDLGLDRRDDQGVVAVFGEGGDV